MNVFSSDTLLRALATTYFPDQPAEIAIHTVEGHAFRLLRIGKKPITSAPMVDYWEPAAIARDTVDSNAHPLRYLPRVALTSTVFTGETLRLDGLSASPFIDLRKFPTWDDLQRFVHGRQKRIFQDSQRRMRRLDQEVGPVVVTLEDDDDGVIDSCVAWRSKHFRSASRMHRDPRHVVFLQTLRDHGVARVASLRAGGQLVAAVVGLPYEGRFSYWIVAYDDSFGAYSPGRLQRRVRLPRGERGLQVDLRHARAPGRTGRPAARPSRRDDGGPPAVATRTEISEASQGARSLRWSPRHDSRGSESRRPLQARSERRGRLATEVLGEQFVAGVARVTAPADQPVTEDHRFVGQVQRPFHELLDEQHGDALVARPFE